MNPIRSALRPNRMRTSTTLATAVVLTLALTGCGGHEKKKPDADTSHPPTAPTTALVQGTLQFSGGPAGPTSGPAQGKPKSIAGTIVFKGPNGSTTKTQVDATGKFAIGLYPGTYTIEGSSPLYEDGKGRCATDPATTTLTAGRTVTADVYCQIK